MPRKKKSMVKSSPAQREQARMAVASGLSYDDAARLVGITKDEVMRSLREVPDEVMQEMIRVTSRAMILRNYMTAIKIIDAISDEDIKKASLTQKAHGAAALMETVTKSLIPTAELAQEEHHNLSMEDVGALLGSIQQKVTRLKIQQTTVESDSTPIERSDPGPDDGRIITDGTDLPGVVPGQKPPS